MRIAFLCKRQYTGHDVISDRYGRLYEIPLHLARIGHTVHGYCMDYHHREGYGNWSHQASPGVLHWESQALGKLKFPTLLGYPSRILKELEAFRPDIIVGASDIPHVALAAWLAEKLRVPCAVDLYDNFESFGQARIPGFHAALRWAVRKANLVIVVSQGLRQFVEGKYQPGAPILVMGNSLDTSLFHQRDRAAARASFGLPMDAKLIGTAGSLYLEKGFAPLCAAWEKISATRNDVQLVLAGPVEKGITLPKGNRVHYLGNLPYTRVPELFSALDVGIVSVMDSPFGRYCFPQKVSEMLACGLAVTAADIGVTSELFADIPEALFRTADAQDMAEAIVRQLDHPIRPDRPIRGWEELVADIEPRLRALAAIDTQNQ
ncbi:glycosyltransferase family 4 protein [Rhodanobacter sp. DHG33]|uniref:glycosyltransferase family 4 protein n=1 Tax=Rhodanobacter sp. DHG33 TaxID=2775921 RepID=UPI0017875BA0|nr:glycosyltransferase family 4 protein [Rhodanobacter sp. DHG33]MBD8899291.1 glycosyltransferase family 4 protein [Rhodanobacter sp. DHG33]